jgi:hypothetical protein
MVHLQELLRRNGDVVKWFDSDANELEVIGPAVGAWMKKSDQARRFDREATEVASLMIIANGTGPGQVFPIRTTTMLAAYDVAHLTAPKVSSSCIRQYSQTW